MPTSLTIGPSDIKNNFDFGSARKRRKIAITDRDWEIEDLLKLTRRGALQFQ
jgi:hypothetical protein